MRNRRRGHRSAEGGGGGPLTYDREAHLRVLFERVARADSADAWPIVLECLDEAAREPERVIPVAGVLRVILHLVADGDREHASALYARLKEWAAASNTRLLGEDPRWKHVRELMELADAPRQVEVAAAALEDPQRAEQILHPPPPRYVPPPAPQRQSQLGCLVPLIFSAVAFLIMMRAMLSGGGSRGGPPYHIPPRIDFRWDAALIPPMRYYDPIEISAERVRHLANGDRDVTEAADLIEDGARRGDCTDVKRGLERMTAPDGGDLESAQRVLEMFARGRCPDGDRGLLQDP